MKFHTRKKVTAWRLLVKHRVALLRTPRYGSPLRKRALLNAQNRELSFMNPLFDSRVYPPRKLNLAREILLSGTPYCSFCRLRRPLISRFCERAEASLEMRVEKTGSSWRGNVIPGWILYDGNGFLLARWFSWLWFLKSNRYGYFSTYTVRSSGLGMSVGLD